MLVDGGCGYDLLFCLGFVTGWGVCGCACFYSVVSYVGWLEVCACSVWLIVGCFDFGGLLRVCIVWGFLRVLVCLGVFSGFCFVAV